jgi:DNA-binding transcriptional regulator YiaG
MKNTRDLPATIPFTQHMRFVKGDFSDKHAIRDFRRFINMTQDEFADALDISIHTLRNWEQGHRHPSRPALKLLQAAAAHPSVLRNRVLVH